MRSVSAEGPREGERCWEGICAGMGAGWRHGTGRCGVGHPGGCGVDGGSEDVASEAGKAAAVKEGSPQRISEGSAM